MNPAQFTPVTQIQPAPLMAVSGVRFIITTGDGDGGPFTNGLWDDTTTWDDSSTFN